MLIEKVISLGIETGFSQFYVIFKLWPDSADSNSFVNSPLKNNIL